MDGVWCLAQEYISDESDAQIILGFWLGLIMKSIFFKSNVSGGIAFLFSRSFGKELKKDYIQKIEKSFHTLYLSEG